MYKNKKKNKNKNKKWIIGIDEVGRGPLAGPITVCACAVITKNKWLRVSNIKQNMKDILQKVNNLTKSTKSKRQNIKDKLPPLRDSKKLSASQREEWFRYIQKLKKEKKIFYATISISPKIIDRINITRAANYAATRAYEKLILSLIKNNPEENRRIKTKNKKIILHSILCLDGGLYLEEPYKKIGKTIIKGDEKIPAISFASIIAKVTRDRYMTKIHKKYPQYGFDSHKGYGTRAHYKALARYGASPLHRKSFIP